MHQRKLSLGPYPSDAPIRSVSGRVCIKQLLDFFYYTRLVTRRVLFVYFSSNNLLYGQLAVKILRLGYRRVTTCSHVCH